eukprot:4447217-Amphidinium_carterae.1
MENISRQQWLCLTACSVKHAVMSLRPKIIILLRLYRLIGTKVLQLQMACDALCSDGTRLATRGLLENSLVQCHEYTVGSKELISSSGVTAKVGKCFLAIDGPMMAFAVFRVSGARYVSLSSLFQKVNDVNLIPLLQSTVDVASCCRGAMLEPTTIALQSKAQNTSLLTFQRLFFAFHTWWWDCCSTPWPKHDSFTSRRNICSPESSVAQSLRTRWDLEARGCNGCCPSHS